VIDHARVSTMLTAPERGRVDAAGTGLYVATHRDSIDEVIGDVRTRRAHAVVISVACCAGTTTGRVVRRVGSIVRDFPRVATVALLTDADDLAPSVVLALGRSGVETLIDARHPTGWRSLREAVAQCRSSAAELSPSAVEQLHADLCDAPADCRRFFDMLFSAPVGVATVQALSLALEVPPTTLVSRFARRGLPSPKAYLAVARITRAAALFEDPSMSVAAVAAALEYSSSQSFGRHLRQRLGLTPSVFRRRYDGRGMFDLFRRELILPYADTLRTFAPLAPPCINAHMREPGMRGWCLPEKDEPSAGAHPLDDVGREHECQHW
jgi:AraC-like DNA-binding protein